MADITVIPAAEPSMADLRAMRDATAEPTVTKAETPEPVKVINAEPELEPVKETGETKQEPTVEDEPLPEGVQKRIAKEAEKAARIQSEIDRAVSTRKAKEKELADLAASGSAPVQKAAAEKSAPKHGEPGHEEETYGEFLARERAHHRAEDAISIRQQVREELEAEQRETTGKARRAEAIKSLVEAGSVKDEAEFSSLMATAEGIAPDGLQTAISAQEDWAPLAVHLAKNPAKLKELAALYSANPFAAVAKLGHIQAGLKSATKPAAEAVLPNPPAKEGGGASASAGAFDIEKASMSQLRRHATKLGLRKAG